MFSGLVEAVGTIVHKEDLASGIRLTVEHPFDALELGESVATSGTCLTVIADRAEGSARRMVVELSIETLERTTLGKLGVGSRVNLERSLTLSTKLGGHLVTGHVDAKAVVESVEEHGDMTRVVIRVPDSIAPYTAEKGSLTIEGVSLTINRSTRETVELFLIPHTRQVTTLGELAPGREVNVEVDLVARYVARLLDFRAQ